MKYTIATTEEQEAVLTWLTAVSNRDHDTKLTNNEFMELRFAQMLAPFTGLYKEAVSEAVQKQFSKATPELQAQITSLLSVVP